MTRFEPDEEFRNKVLGCMQISAVTPLTFTLQADQTVAVHCHRRLLGQVGMTLFAQLTPREILKTLGIPTRQAGAG